jgi:two-component system sensor histidine kinase UhpB
VTTRSSPTPASDDARDPRRRPAALSIFWWVFLVNLTVLGASALLLIVTPIRITPRIAAAEAAIVIAGFVAMLAISIVLLREVLAPLRSLTALMSEIDPLTPGRRLEERGTRHAEVATMTRAFNSMLDRLEDERHQSSRRVIEAQEAERSRIARELHDDIGQTLTATAIDAERAADAGPDERAQALLRVAGALRASLDDVRRIARELRPDALEDLGLGNAIISLARRVDASSGVRVRTRIPASLPRMMHATEVVVYRVAQESLTNVIRHSDAQEAEVALVAVGDSAILTVRDDGRGIAPGAHGTGIVGMRERAMLAGGQLTVGPSKGGGTEVRLSVPLEDNR